MKKTITILWALIFTMVSFTFGLPKKAYALELYNMTNYYDFNHDGFFNIADLIICNNYMEKGKLSLNDERVLQYYILNGEWSEEILFEEWDIDEMLPTEDNLLWLQTVMSSQIVDLEVSESVRVRFLNDVCVTEIRLETIDSIVESIATLDFNGTRIVLGLTEDGHFAWDTYSFDLTPNYSEDQSIDYAFTLWDIDNLEASEENTKWLKDIMSNKLIYIEYPKSDTDSVCFIFLSKEEKMLAIKLGRFEKISETIAILDFNDEKIVLGKNDKCEYVLDYNSFDHT